MKKSNLKDLIIAHRGIHDNVIVPENSMLAFILSVNKNVAIELDVQCTKDNEVVVFHDLSLKRMTSVNKLVKNTTLDSIKTYKLIDTNYTIPTLKEVLDLVNGRVLIDIEIKNIKRKQLKYLEKILKDYEGDYIISSFIPSTVNYFKKRKYITGLLLGVSFFNKRATTFFCKPDFLAISKNFIKLKKVQKKRRSCTLFVWTISKDEINEYSQYSDSFICNIKTGS